MTCIRSDGRTSALIHNDNSVCSGNDTVHQSTVCARVQRALISVKACVGKTKAAWTTGG